MKDAFFYEILNNAKVRSEKVLAESGITTDQLDDYSVLFFDYGVAFCGELPKKLNDILYGEARTTNDNPLIVRKGLHPIEELHNHEDAVLVAAAQLWVICKYVTKDISQKKTNILHAGYSIGRLISAIDFPETAKRVISENSKENVAIANKPFLDAKNYSRVEAEKIWATPPVLRKKTMIKSLRLQLEAKQELFGLPRIPTDEKIWEWVKDLAPDEVKRPGRPKKNN